ncbi:MAG: putative rane protein [Herbinix sp.]|nr:putative rane protein [Herbinix sp.]
MNDTKPKLNPSSDSGLMLPHTNRIKLLSFPYIIWMAGFIIIPLVMILFYGLTNKENSFTLENLAAIAEPINLQALGLALLLSIISTVICLILSYPLSIILNNIKLKSNSLIIFIIILPMWMNFLLRTIAWQNILEKSGTLNTLLTFLHLPTINIINTPAAIILGMVYNYLPFMILPIYNVLIKIDQDVINAARDLGANTLQTFTKIIFPLSLPGVISGITMVFVPSLTTFAISSILGGSKILLMGNVIEQQFTLGNWHAGSGLSLVLMIFVLLCMAILSKYDKEAEGSNIW